MRRAFSIRTLLALGLVIFGGCGSESGDEPEQSTDAATTDTATPPAPPIFAGFTNSIGMKFKLIPAGEFLMGGGESAAEVADLFDKLKEEHLSNEYPQHRVRISRPFLMGVFEVTQAQYIEVMGSRPWSERGNIREDIVKEGSDYAANNMPWNDAVEFCRRLSKIEGRHYRLPTEAEWEYACRAGTTTLYHFGDDPSRLTEYAWFSTQPSDLDNLWPRGVGQKKPNPWGLYDMYGNTGEWCQDFWELDNGYYANSPTEDPTGPATGSARVYRGGTFAAAGFASNCRSAARTGWPAFGGLILGFRVVLEVPADG